MQQTGFQYTYTSIEDIFANITTLAQFSIVEYVILAAAIGFVLALVYALLPTLFIAYQYRAKERNKIMRKKLLTQITMQREIEEEIENEIKMTEESKIAGNI